jgi:hypothetical protein
MKARINQDLSCASAAVEILRLDRAQLGLLLPHAIQLLEPTGESDQSQADAKSFAQLAEFNKALASANGANARMLSYLMGRLLEYGQRIHLQRHELANQRAVEGAFSEPWLKELAQLSERNAVLVDKYGDKQIEKRFEQQLTILFQTFGFLTVPAVSGEPVADLLCVCREGPEKFSFLVDAKSSKRPYSFPKADQRALLEYVQETKRSLIDLPPLRFAVLVGHGPGSTISAKLKELEGKAGIPLRFIAAADLAHLRGRHTGALRLDFFLETMMQATPVVSTDAWEQMLNRQSEFHETYTQFVRKMRTVGISAL